MYGIDYGTYCSSICEYSDECNKPIPLLVSESSYILRSSIDKLSSNEIVVGSVTENSSRSPKRYLNLEDETAIKDSYYILRKLRSATEKECISAVVTIPVNYNHSQREATRLACEMANINVIRFISEPVAIALNYDFIEEKVIILDIGGGTTDVSLVEFDKTLNFYEVLKSDGNSNLGGEYINELIYKSLKVETSYTSLYSVIEQAKKQLGIHKEVSIDNIKLSCEDIKNICLPFFNQIIDLLKPFITEDNESILLAGGCSNIYGLKEVIFKHFPHNKVLISDNPDLLVSMGACHYAKALSSTENALTLVDIAPLSLGISDYQNAFVPIINKGTCIPVSVSKLFTLSEDSDNINIKIYQGERKMCEDNVHIGHLDINFGKLLKKGEPKIKVTFTLNYNSILNINVTESSSDLNFFYTVTQDKLYLSSEKIKKLIEEAEMYKVADKKAEKEALLMTKLTELITTVELAGFNCDDYKTFDNLDVSKLEELIQQLAKEFPFCLVKPQMGSSTTTNNFTEINLEDEEKAVIMDKIRHIEKTVEITQEVSDILDFVNDQLAQENVNYFNLKLILDDLILDKKVEYFSLVDNIKENIDQFNLSEEKQRQLLDFINVQSGFDYSRMITELNEFCSTLVD